MIFVSLLHLFFPSLFDEEQPLLRGLSFFFLRLAGICAGDGAACAEGGAKVWRFEKGSSVRESQDGCFHMLGRMYAASPGVYGVRSVRVLRI